MASVRCSLCGVWLLLSCVLAAAPITPARRMAQNVEPVSNLVAPRQQTSEYEKWQGPLNDTLFVIRMDPVVRLSGARFVPFTTSDQHVVVQAFRGVFLPNIGPVELLSYKEFYPDPAAPSSMQDSSPCVDIAFRVFWVQNSTAGLSPGQNVSPSDVFAAFYAWSSAVVKLGKWEDVAVPQLLTAPFNRFFMQGGFTLHPIVVLGTRLALTLAPGSAGNKAVGQASLLAQTLEGAILDGIGTLVEVVNITQAAQGVTLRGAGTLVGSTQGALEVHLEVTLFMCRDGAPIAFPECEQQILTAVIDQLLQSKAVKAQWLAAGIQSVSLAGMRPRNPPAPPADPAPKSPWVPWHLDRIDQRSLPLDGRFTANATGTGVNVYILSSGVNAEHIEFRPMGSESGTRVSSFWGYQGIDPLQDCVDGRSFNFGYGTTASSLCCGLQLGVAKNATIHSVRMREKCMSNYSPDALLSALDAVIASYKRPAVLLIDTWWYPGRTGSSEAVKDGLIARLDTLGREGVVMVAAAGPGLNLPSTPCSNVIGSHPAVISVAAVDTHDQATAFGPRDSTCIDLWAPGGGLGTHLISAHPYGPSKYTSSASRAFGSAAIVAGVAAQVLEFNPQATPAQVLQVLQGDATRDAVMDAGANTTNQLLFTDFTEPMIAGAATGSGAEHASEEAASGGLSTGAIAGIAVTAFVATGAVVLAVIALASRRKRQISTSNSRPDDQYGSSAWEVGPDEIEVCLHPDGTKWLLGEGRYGRVYKAMKRGVQVVAIKQLSHIDERQRKLFIKEIDMLKYVSRDANITQFFAACVEGDNVSLIQEYMEGGDLRNALSGDRAEELQWYRHGKEVMCDILRGVDFLHSNNVIHRDIKSKNVLLGRDGRAKLSDVGLAQLFDRESAPTKKGHFVGTLAWAAPEVLQGLAHTEKADMFALGVVLWELVTLEVPHRGQLRDPLIPQECPQGVLDAMRACMQPDPALRPDARQLYTLLQSCAPFNEASHDGRLLPSSGGSSKEIEIAIVTGSSSSGDCDLGQRQRVSTPRIVDEPIGSCPSARQLSEALSFSTLVSMSVDKLEFVRNKDGSKQELGSGSFGTVYKVLLDGVQTLAAKMVSLGEDPGVHSAFLQEAGLLWRLRHPNIVALSGVCISEGQGYLLMELMEGGSLHTHLNARSRSSGQRVFGWYNRGRHVLLDIAAGLHYLHSMRMTHFDIKAANCLLTRQLNAKVADVGLARMMSCTHHSIAPNDALGPGLMGTFAYMAPELMAGTKCDQSADIFSFGVLLAEICSGAHPVRGRAMELDFPEECPEAVADLFKQCTAIIPSERPTAREVVERLRLACHAGAPEPPSSGKHSDGISNCMVEIPGARTAAADQVVQQYLHQANPLANVVSPFKALALP